MFSISKLTTITSLCFLLGCGSGELKRRNLDEYYVGSGVVRYFLADVPLWANFSSIANCHRKTPKRFFNMKSVRDSFSSRTKISW